MAAIKLTRNLGNGWPHRWRENETVDADDALADKLLEAGLAVRVELNHGDTESTEKKGKPKSTKSGKSAANDSADSKTPDSKVDDKPVPDKPNEPKNK